MLVKNKCNLSSGFIVCVLVRSISVATYGKCLFNKKTFENVWSINARINPHGEAETLICWMFGCTFGFNSDMSNDLHICVHVTHVSTLIKLCGHEKPTCSQTQVCMSLLSMLKSWHVFARVHVVLLKMPLIWFVMFGCTFCFDSDRSIDLYMCAMRTCRSSCVCGHEQPTYSQIHACIFTSTMYKSWHGLEQG